MSSLQKNKMAARDRRLGSEINWFHRQITQIDYEWLPNLQWFK